MDPNVTPPRPLARFLPTLTGPVLGLAAVLAVFVILLGFKGEEDALANFLSLANIQVIVYSKTYIAVLALAMLLVIISGGIDLSVGSVIALVTVVTMGVYRWCLGRDLSVESASIAAVLAGVATGGACGFINGCVITRLRLAPFVTTLGMLSIARGLAYWLAGGRPMAFPGGVRPYWVKLLSESEPRFGVFYPGFWSLTLLALAVALLLHTTVLGRYCYAIGSSEATARLCGVPIERDKIVLYTLAGLLNGWGGILLFASVGSGEPGVAVGTELDVIAAVVIGGASLAGGQGTVMGTLLGVLILGILENGVRRFQMPLEMQYILVGLIIIANTALGRWRQKT